MNILKHALVIIGDFQAEIGFSSKNPGDIFDLFLIVFAQLSRSVAYTIQIQRKGQDCEEKSKEGRKVEQKK